MNKNINIIWINQSNNFCWRLKLKTKQLRNYPKSHNQINAWQKAIWDILTKLKLYPSTYCPVMMQQVSKTIKSREEVRGILMREPHKKILHKLSDFKNTWTCAEWYKTTLSKFWQLNPATNSIFNNSQQIRPYNFRFQDYECFGYKINIMFGR